MKFKKTMSVLLTVLLAFFLLTACEAGKSPDAGAVTSPADLLTPAAGIELTLRDGLSVEAYAADSPVGEWLLGCSGEDRDDHFDAYVLRHETADGGNTTFTYLIYYPHEQSSLAAKATIAEGDSGDGYVLGLSYGEGSGTEGYSLCYLSFTLPTDQAPRLRIYKGTGSLGLMSTVTSEPIPAP
jgi:hypothetical protein